jgi:hypothetical protein
LIIQLDTTISRNVPSTMNLPLYDRRTEEAETFFEGKRTVTYKENLHEAPGEYIVDNEDPGFSVAGGGDNKLRSAIRRIFSGSSDEVEYLGYNPSNPPGRWIPVINQDFYGRILRTGMMIKVGEGGNTVSWTADLPSGGNYDIYFYNETMRFGRGRGGQRGGGRGNRGPVQEEKTFIVHHEDGTEEIPVDIREASHGWILLGTFNLTAGANTVEQTDKGKGDFLTADAVRWVKTDLK